MFQEPVLLDPENGGIFEVLYYLPLIHFRIRYIWVSFKSAPVHFKGAWPPFSDRVSVPKKCSQQSPSMNTTFGTSQLLQEKGKRRNFHACRTPENAEN